MTNEHRGPGEEEVKRGFLDRFRSRVQGTMNESRLPTEEYESTVGVYGGKLVQDSDKRLVFNNHGIVSKLDRFGDALLRSFDEHTVKDLGKLFRHSPKSFFRFLAPGTKRYRGTSEEILENVERLGLGEYYGAHPDGIEIKKPEIYTQGKALQDIYRADIIDAPALEAVDRFQALATAGRYVREVHDDRGPIGELLVSDIIFQEEDDSGVEKPVLNLPDIIYNPNKYQTPGKTPEAVGLKEKKATDLLDFLASITVEELRRSEGSEEEVRRALKTTLDGYADAPVISLVKSLAERGRLTLQGDVEFLDLPDTLMTKLRPLTAQHNKARIGSTKDIDGLLKQIIVDACAGFNNQEEGK